MSNPKRLFVWSAGGCPGLDIHAGIASALYDYGFITPDAHHSGTSAGAFFAAWHACGRTSADLLQLLRGLRDRDVRSERFAWKIRFPWITHFLSNTPIRKLLDANLPSTWPKPDNCRIWATDSLLGCPVDVSTLAGPTNSVLASMAIAGAFPRVTIRRRVYQDGGSCAYLPIPPDLTPYDEIWLLVAQTCPSDYRKSTGILTHLMTGSSWALVDQVNRTIAKVAQDPRIRIIRPNLHSPAGALRFDHSLIQKSYAFTFEALRAI